MRIPELRRILADYFDLEQYEADALIARIAPVILLDDISPEPQKGKSGPRWAMGQSDISAVAAQYSISHLQNPTGSGIVAEVFDLWVGGAGTHAFTVGFHEVEAAGSSPEKLVNRYYESLAGVPSDPTCRVTEETNAATGIQAGENLFRGYSPNNDMLQIPLNGCLVLKPGTGVRAVNMTVNESFHVVWRWRESPEK